MVVGMRERVDVKDCTGRWTTPDRSGPCLYCGHSYSEHDVENVAYIM